MSLARVSAASGFVPPTGIMSGDKAGNSSSIFLISCVSGLIIKASPVEAIKPTSPSLISANKSIALNRARVKRLGLMSLAYILADMSIIKTDPRSV